MPGVALRLTEREEIRAGLERGWSCRRIARELGRDPSTVSREVCRNGGRHDYRAVKADRRARRCRRRPKVLKLVADVSLARHVERELATGFSPAAIAVRLRQRGEATVVAETIYQALYSATFRGLRPLPSRCLRTRRRHRRARDYKERRRGPFANARSIDERPAAVRDRTEAGHWEGDLLVGKQNRSAVITLVERTSRYLIVKRIADRNPTTVAAALIEVFASVPPTLRRSLTWDRGFELIGWRQVEAGTAMPVFFCHPSSPWERPSNENTNRLLRFWLPKGTDLAVHAQAHLDQIAQTINAHPRRLFGWDTAADRYLRLAMH